MALLPKWSLTDLWSAIKTKDDDLRDVVNKLAVGPAGAVLTKTSSTDFDFGWGSGGILEKSLDLGVWNMQTQANKQMSFPNIFGVPDALEKVVSVSVFIINDAKTAGYPVPYGNTSNANIDASLVVTASGVNGENITIDVSRTAGGAFSGANFSNAIINRGKIVIRYQL